MIKLIKGAMLTISSLKIVEARLWNSSCIKTLPEEEEFTIKSSDLTLIRDNWTIETHLNSYKYDIEETSNGKLIISGL